MIKSSLAFKSSSVLLDGCFWRSKWAISYHIHDCGGKMKSTCTLWVMADILWFVACTCSFLPSGVQNLCPRTAELAVTFICFCVQPPHVHMFAIAEAVCGDRKMLSTAAWRLHKKTNNCCLVWRVVYVK